MVADVGERDTPPLRRHGQASQPPESGRVEAEPDTPHQLRAVGRLPRWVGQTGRREVVIPGHDHGSFSPDEIDHRRVVSIADQVTEHPYLVTAEALRLSEG